MIQLVIITGILLCTSLSWAETIILPDRASRIDEAVAMASSGDTILIATDQIDWGTEVIVRNKDLTIQGRSNEQRAVLNVLNHHLYEYYDHHSEPRPYTLLLENSNLTLQYVQLDEPYHPKRITATSIAEVPTLTEVRGGSLTLLDSAWQCSIHTNAPLVIQNTEFKGYSRRYETYYYHHQPGPEPIPAIHVESASGVEISISNSSIYEKGFEGIRFTDSYNSDLHLINSTVQSGRTYGCRCQDGVPGQPGIHMITSHNIRLNLSGSVIQASDGGHVFYSSPHGYEKLGPGGTGMVIENSLVNLRGGIIQGGKGDNGFVYNPFIPYLFHGANGGHGIELIQSTVIYERTEFVAGKGGDGKEENGGVAEPGEPGKPIRLDEGSTIEALSSVLEWGYF